MSSPSLPLTSLIGREQDITTVIGLLGHTRLVSLVGAAGSGKTRLAAAACDRWVAEHGDGAIWAELAALHDAELLAAHVLTVAGVEQGARSAVTALIDAWRATPRLLVIDNCEHLVDAAAALIDALLRGCPSLRVLATSREPLGVGGERMWRVPGLPEGEAVTLFVDRAQAALPSFSLTPANSAAVTNICRRLDGLPLAIELAAARVSSLTPEQIDARLDDLFRVLASGARTAVDRHRSLREAIAWSYRLLDDRERLLLQRLSAFGGDFALDEAERVAGDDALDARDVLDTLSGLVDKSLVVMRDDDGSLARYHLLEAIRQFAEQELQRSGAHPLICGRHAFTYAALVEQAAPHFTTRDRPRWVAAVHRELDNIRLALTCSRDHHADAHVHLVGNLGWFWYSSGLWSEGRRWLEDAIALEAPEIAPADRAAALLGGGVIASLQADSAAALRWLDEAVTIYRSVGDRRGEAYALAYIGISHGQSGNPAAVEPAERALAWFRGSGDLYGQRLALVVLSTCALLLGQSGRALQHAEEASKIAREFGLDRELAIALQIHATAVLGTGNLSAAAELLVESLDALRRDPSTFWTARGLQLLGLVRCHQGDTREGVRLLGAAEANREMLGASLLPHDRERAEPVVSAAREKLGRDEFELAWANGRMEKYERGPREHVREHERHERHEGHALAVRGFGHVEIRRDGVVVPSSAWRAARPRELLLYLLAHPDGRTREQIGLTFWPDASAAQVRNSFHVTLHYVRKALGRTDLVTFDRDRYRIAWELGVTFDVQEFRTVLEPAVRRSRAVESAFDATRVAAALDLYRGDFLAAEGAGDWHLNIRDGLRRLFVDAAVQLGERELVAGRHPEARTAFERAIAVDGLHEPAYRGLMLCLARQGNRPAAMRHFERLAAVLDRELQVAPGPDTRALYESLKRELPA